MAADGFATGMTANWGKLRPHGTRMSGVHIVSDLTLGLGTVVHDYLQTERTRHATAR
jgi:acetoacetate decarboxylase